MTMSATSIKISTYDEKKKCKRNLTNLGKREILVHLDGNGEEEIFFS